MTETACFSDFDLAMMQRALALAELGRFSSSPNPRVGCVIARNGQIVGEGFHLRAGEAHAEIHALNQAGAWARGATAYVTLEPCSHHGRTGPCADALIAAGVGRVVAAMADPNPHVAGQGLARLQAAGIPVQSGLLLEQARTLNRGFLSRIERGRPFVRLKAAASLDGKTALRNGASQWITGAESRADVQVLRAESCAVLTGVGTVLADNPRLNVRDFPVLRQPYRIIVDSRLRTPSASVAFEPDGGAVWLAGCVAEAARHGPYTERGAQVFRLPETDTGHVDLHALLALLAQQGIGELLLETGATLSTAFLQAGLVDEIVLYQSPKILGDAAQGLFRLPEQPSALQQRPQWQTRSVQMMGSDIKWVLQPHHSAP